ncbi:hypothetical protein PanWU01x14_283120, partial [Parasponia andersonii]
MDPKRAALINTNPIKSPIVSKVSRKLPEGVVEGPPRLTIVDLISLNSEREITYTIMSNHFSPINLNLVGPSTSNHEKTLFNNLPDQVGDKVMPDQPEAMSQGNTPFEPTMLYNFVLPSSSNSPIYI